MLSKAENVGWCILMVAGIFAVAGYLQGWHPVTEISVFGTLVGVAAISVGQGYRAGFRAGKNYYPVLEPGPSVGPPG